MEFGESWRATSAKDGRNLMFYVGCITHRQDSSPQQEEPIQVIEDGRYVLTAFSGDFNFHAAKLIAEATQGKQTRRSLGVLRMMKAVLFFLFFLLIPTQAQYVSSTLPNNGAPVYTRIAPSS